jgi:hypothetical protein
MRVRVLAAVAALALGTAIGGGAAHAATYLLDTSGAFGTGSFGEVTVTGTSTDLHFDVQLFGSYQIIDTGSHFSFSGNLSGVASGFTLSLPSSEYYTTGSPPTSQPDFTLSTDTSSGISNPPFAGFDFALNCQSCGSGASGPFGSHLIFDILGTGLSVQPATSYGEEPIFFAADVTNADGGTGAVGGGPPGGGVPEPATWGLMLTGVFCIGAAMRQRRQRALTAA